MNSYFELGYVPALLGSTIWRVRLAGWFGRANFFVDRNLSNKGISIGTKTRLPSMNILTLVEDLPQGMVDRLSNNEIKTHFQFHMLAVESIQWRNNLPYTNILDVARDDYNCSTQEILENRYPQARWAAQQCVEKTLKGMLEIGGNSYPKGIKGHDLSDLAKLLREKHGVAINPNFIQTAQCTTGARYNDEPSTQKQALHANLAALGIYDTLRQSPQIERLLNDHNKNNPTT
ncbi:MAG: HEPN domain-containing protein [Pedobacter sp.]|nr:MAG: HEPN domain-containing protein [Pedobacter sp.]